MHILMVNHEFWLNGTSFPQTDECLVLNSDVCLLLLSELYNVKPYHRFAVKRCFDGR